MFFRTCLVKYLKKNGILEKARFNYINALEHTEQLLRKVLLDKPIKIPELEEERKSLEYKASETTDANEKNSIFKKTVDLRAQIEAYQSVTEASIKDTMQGFTKNPIPIADKHINDMQINNLERLGITKVNSIHRIEVDKIPTGIAKIVSSLHSKNYVEVETTESIVLTSLGELFIKSCLEKTK